MNLLIEHKCRVLQLTLNRPEKRNALDFQLATGLVDAIQAAQSDDQVGAILITAAGKVFCSGMDLDEAHTVDPERLADVHEALFTMGVHSLKPIVIGVNGPAYGGGLGLVAQGHVVLASEGAAFSLSEIRVGLWPFLIYRSVEAALGPSRMLELSLCGRSFSAQDALRWSLVHQISPAAEVEERATSLARDLAKASPAAISAGMQYYRDSRDKSAAEAGALARRLRSTLMDSGDFAEGRLAFKEKREPRWPSMPPEFYNKRHSRAS